MTVEWTDEQFRLVRRAIWKEIKALEGVHDEMVGALYPSMVRAEIDRLRRAAHEMDRWRSLEKAAS